VSKLFTNRSVGTKVLCTVGFLAVVTAVVGGVGIAKLNSTATHAADVYDQGVLPLIDVETMHMAVQEVVANVALHSNASGAAAMARYERNLTVVEGELTAAQESYASGPGSAERDEALAHFSQTWTAFRKLYTETLLPLSRADKQVEWNSVFAKQGEPLVAKADTDMDALIELETDGAKQDADASVHIAHSARTTLVVVLVVGLALALAIGMWLSRLIVTPLRAVAAALDAVADGDLTGQVQITGKDEVGVMAVALNRATESMRTAMRTIDSSASTLSTAASELAGVSAQIAGSAQGASTQAEIVSAAAEEVSRNVQTVAASSEEMSASIREISQNANEAVKVASQAVLVAETTNATVTKLGDSSTEIGNVVKVITSIAEQTNLLALNATIEAARAGEAGKGFAVVANEVKDLAQETARATEDISRRVAAIQGDTAGAVEAIGEIGRIIGQINDYQLTIAAATEQQSATTEEMTRNVTEAATGSAEIASNISGVASATETTRGGVAQAQRAAEDLTRTSAELSTIVSRFRM
jgi:methyl-accepting chemotaxis protein